MKFLSIFLICFTLASPAVFASDQEDKALAYLSETYRQAGLAQQISRSICEISAFHNEQDNRQFLELAAQRLPQSKDPDWRNIRFALTLLSQIRSYPDIEQEIISGSSERLFDLLLTEAADYLIKNPSTPYAATYERLLRLDVQFQKLTVDMCFGKTGDRHFEIDQSIDELIFGNLEENVLPAPSGSLQAMLIDLKENWEAVRNQPMPDVRPFFQMLNRIAQAYQREYKAYRAGS